jgi:diguanylate cyclase (GGDEF)-like protein/PAS domain S-box-containing protein
LEVRVLEKIVALPMRQAALQTLLATHPDAVVAALADDGFRVALPDSFDLRDHRALAVPTDRATMLDIVVAADRLAVVTAWERARTSGIGVAAVRALSDPGTRLTLSIVDARDDYGVWLSVLTHDREELDSSSHVLAGPLVVPARPRQATMHKNMTAVITEIDANVTRMFGWEPDQMLGSRSSEFMHPDDQERAVATWMTLLATPGSQRVRVRHRCADGRWLWVETENIHNGAEDPDEVDVVTHITDISDEMAAHEALRRREQLFSRLAESLPTGVLQVRCDGSVVYANARLGAILHTGTPTAETDLFANIVPADRPAVDAAIEAALQRGIDDELEVEIRTSRAQSSRRCAVSVAAVADEDGLPGALICLNDVTESAQLRDELKLRATHDALTGCLNRSAVMQALTDRLSAGDGEQTAVIFVDVDNFKPVNDRLGHAAGDELLVHLARRLQGLSREQDFVGRLGGDEFLLVCCGVEIPAQATAIAERVRDALNQTVVMPAGKIEVRSSIGVAWSETDATAETLVEQADSAMYASKRRHNAEPVSFADIADRVSSRRPRSAA